jgi:hypothetical protein
MHLTQEKRKYNLMPHTGVIVGKSEGVMVGVTEESIVFYVCLLA